MKYVFICDEGHLMVRGMEDYRPCTFVRPIGDDTHGRCCKKEVYRWHEVQEELQPEA